MKNEIEKIIARLLSCTDGKYIEEIYAKDGSIVNGEFGNWVGLMVETCPEFTNESRDGSLSLYDCINDIEDEARSFRLVISVEPNMASRGHGTILYKKGE